MALSARRPSDARSDRLAVDAQGVGIGRRQLFGAAALLAERLPEASHVINRCSDRFRFLVGFVAAMARGQITVLPHDATPRTLAALAERHRGLYALSDGQQPETLLPHVTVGGAGRETSDEFLPADASLVAELYTSGSTGAPTAHGKTLGALRRGAEITARRLGLGAGGPAAVATVPPQHMFGFETTIMLPLCNGLVVECGRPFYPADIAAALARLPAPRALITSPAHLRALLAAAPALPDVELMLSATAPLPVAVADAAERQFKTQVCEIFGSTETGAIATRRTVAGERWRLLDGIALAREGAFCRVEADHLPHRPLLNDLVEPVPGGFTLIGRTADMLNVAGKRASLAGLNAILCEIAGVEDGAFYQPEASGPGRQRLIALVVTQRKPDDIRRELRRRVDPVFLPRRILKVEALPRSETGKVSMEALRALAARALAMP